MELEDTETGGSSAAFLKQLREKHAEPMRVIWDRVPIVAMRCGNICGRRETMPLVNLPGYRGVQLG